MGLGEKTGSLVGKNPERNETKWNETKRNGKDRQKCGFWCSEMRPTQLEAMRPDCRKTSDFSKTQKSVDWVSGLHPMLRQRAPARFVVCFSCSAILMISYQLAVSVSSAVSVSRSYHQVCSGYPARHNVHVHQPRYI